jgi:hypothetical protein
MAIRTDIGVIRTPSAKTYMHTCKTCKQNYYLLRRWERGTQAQRFNVIMHGAAD